MEYIDDFFQGFDDEIHEQESKLFSNLIQPLTPREQKTLKNNHGEETWTTSSYEVISIKNMTFSHLKNVVNFLRRKIEEDAISNHPKFFLLREMQTQMQNNIQKLQQLNSPGETLAKQYLKKIQQQIQQDKRIPEYLLNQLLNNHFKYQCLLKELNLREQKKPTPPDNPFLLEKLKTTIIEIAENKNNQHIGICIESTPEEQTLVQVGDMLFHPENDAFRIVKVKHVYSLTNITLNAKTKKDKEVVLKNLKIDDVVNVY